MKTKPSMHTLFVRKDALEKFSAFYNWRTLIYPASFTIVFPALWSFILFTMSGFHTVVIELEIEHTSVSYSLLNWCEKAKSSWKSALWTFFITNTWLLTVLSLRWDVKLCTLCGIWKVLGEGSESQLLSSLSHIEQKKEENNKSKQKVERCGLV